MDDVQELPAIPCSRETGRLLLGAVILAVIPVLLAHQWSIRHGLWSLVLVLPLSATMILRSVRLLRGELRRSRSLVHQLLRDFAELEVDPPEDPAAGSPPETRSAATHAGHDPLQLLDCIMASAGEAVLVVDRQGRVRLANPAARRLFGLPDRGAVGQRWDRGCRLVRREGQGPYGEGERPLDRALSGEVVDLDVFRVTHSGRQDGAWVSCNARPLDGGGHGGEGAIMVARDISSLVRAEEQILSNEQRLHRLIDRLSAIVWTTDNELRVTSIRGNGLLALGKRPDELLNRSLYELFHVEDPGFRPIAQQLRALRGAATSYEWRWKKRDYAVSTEPLLGPDEKIIGSIGIALDVTEARNTSRQMVVAQQIQERLFPSQDPSPAGYQIGGGTFPAEFAAGDYFDYMPMGDGSLGLVVGDVSGHGVGPAMLMAETRAYLRALAMVEGKVETILERANGFLYSDTDPDKYVTLYLGKLEPKCRRFRFASAGHAPAFLLDHTGRVKARMESTTTPLGLFETMPDHHSRVVDLEPGDLLVILTDGVTDASRDGIGFFGEERALDVVRQHRDQPPRTIVENLQLAIQEYLGPHPQEDDITALVVKVDP